MSLDIAVSEPAGDDPDERYELPVGPTSKHSQATPILPDQVQQELLEGIVRGPIADPPAKQTESDRAGGRLQERRPSPRRIGCRSIEHDNVLHAERGKTLVVDVVGGIVGDIRTRRQRPVKSPDGRKCV
jgi:hypothetical protein